MTASQSRVVIVFSLVVAKFQIAQAHDPVQMLAVTGVLAYSPLLIGSLIYYHVTQLRPSDKLQVIGAMFLTPILALASMFLVEWDPQNWFVFFATLALSPLIVGYLFHRHIKSRRASGT